ncbi:MAG: hypothetical protein ACT4PL_14775, partial [Phycisphaerales bacterium]
MQALADKLRTLNRLDCAAQAHAVLAALAHCSEQERGPLTAHLLSVLARVERRGRLARLRDRIAGDLGVEALRAGALAAPLVSPIDRERLGAVRGMAPVVRELLSAATPGDRQAGATLAGTSGLMELLEDLAPLLFDSDPAVADAAERSLIRAAATVVRPGASRSVPEGSAAFVARALSAALARFGEHRREGVLTALVTFVARGGAVAEAAFAHADSPAQIALARLIRGRRGAEEATTTNAEMLDRVAWRWLKHDALRGACLDRLSTEHAGPGVVSSAHLVAHPSRKAAVASIPVCSLASVAGLIAVGLGRAREKDAALGAMVAHENPLVRHAVLRAGAAMPTRPTCLLDLCFDPDPRVARSAALVVLNQPERGMVRDGGRDRALMAMVRSAHPRVASMARAVLAVPMTQPGEECPDTLALADELDLFERMLREGGSERELATAAQ